MVVDDDRSAGMAGFAHALFSPAGDAGGNAKYAHDCCSQRARIGFCDIRAQHVVRSDAALAVGRAPHWQNRASAEYEFLRFHSIASGVNIWVRCLLKIVDHDVAARPQGQTSVSSDHRIGDNAHRKHHEIGLEDFA